MPQVGEIRSSKQLGYKLKTGKKAGSFSYSKYVWLKCPTCGKERWVCLTKAKEVDFKGFCKCCRGGKGRPSKEELIALYQGEKLSGRELAKRYSVGRGEVKSWFRQYGLKLRSFDEAQMNRRTRVERVCQRCGKNFQVSHCRGEEVKYCSKECSDKAMERGEIVKCGYCGRKFKASPNQLAKGFSKFCSAECRKYGMRRRYRRVCVFCGKEFYAVASAKGLYCSVACRQADPILKQERIRKAHIAAGRHPNKPEVKLLNLLQENHLPYEYVGDGRLVICGYNPDFANVNGKKKLIELFGDYYHSPKMIRYWHETELGRMMAYNSLGYNTLVIWENELNNPEVVIAKVKAWDKRKSGKQRAVSFPR